MIAYGISRNIESSIIQYIENELISSDWSATEVEKSFVRIYTISMPCICIRIEDTDHNSIGLGTTNTTREFIIFVDVFCNSDGDKLDLKDFLIGKLKKGCPYYNYVTNNDTIESKTQDGKITIIEISDSPVNLNINKSDLDIHDRFHQLITLRGTLNTIEE